MERPTGVTVLVVLYLAAAGVLGLTSIVLIFGRSFFAGISGPEASGAPPTARDLALIGLLCLVVALLNVICAIGFIKLKKVSRVLAIVFHLAWAIFWALGLVGLRSHANLSSVMFRLVGLAIQVWIVVYLFGPKVKEAFGTKSV
jgi:hypothetical protein